MKRSTLSTLVILLLCAAHQVLCLSKLEALKKETQGTDQSTQNGLSWGSPPQQCSTSYIRNLIPPGYPFESHTVTTQDGYILTLFRIQAKQTSMKFGKPVVFLQHGLLNDASAWFLNGEDKGLGFLLANAGFDVWLGNNRGCKFSRRHRTLTTADAKFWEFSFDEMAKYDLPANLAYVSAQAGTHHIRYVGHSQGTSQMFAALSDANTRPKVVPYVAVFYALAPIVFLNKNRVPVVNLAASIKGLIKTLADRFGVKYIVPGSCVWDQAQINYWNSKCRLNPSSCHGMVRFTDLDPNVDNWARAGYKKEVEPSGASIDTIYKFAQLISAQARDPNSFPKYDYGKDENLKIYGQRTPPQ